MDQQIWNVMFVLIILGSTIKALVKVFKLSKTVAIHPVGDMGFRLGAILSFLGWGLFLLFLVTNPNFLLTKINLLFGW